MNRITLIKTGVLTLILVTASIAGWELYWRSKGFEPTYNDDKALWALKRPEANKPVSEATVFIGSSRIKFDLDIPTWRRITGEDAVQLALVGTSPLLLLQHLADDEQFKGKLVVDITEVLFFSELPYAHQSAKDAIKFYQKGTPSENLSAALGVAMESTLTFLEERRFSLNTLLNDLSIPNRPGVFALPPFPKGFEWTTRDRQTYMSEMFLSNAADIKRQTDIWRKLISSPVPPMSGDTLKKVLQEIKVAVNKIQDRGGKVIFLRTPSSGPMAEAEAIGYPREKYWEQILAITGADGIHYKDYPNTRDMICPEWSHLSPEDAIQYTYALAGQLSDKGWFSGYTTQATSKL